MASSGDSVAMTVSSMPLFCSATVRAAWVIAVRAEALASGVPVAAYPVQGPLDVIDGTGVGCLNEDLAAAVACALRLPPEACRAFALERSWPNATQQFLGNLAPFG